MRGDSGPQPGYRNPDTGLMSWDCCNVPGCCCVYSTLTECAHTVDGKAEPRPWTILGSQVSCPGH
jgi:hypothetical protein